MKKLLLSLLLITTTIQAHTVYIIIHGTWAAANDWCMPGGDFYDAVTESAQQRDASVCFLIWSGDNSHTARRKAAQQLVNMIQLHPPGTSINIIAHSHGANVGIIASQLLGQEKNNKHTICSFYALGVPINTEQYLPDMNMIQNFYNLFSFSDFIQPILGVCDRQFPPHERIANIRITIDSKEPNHSELHAPAVGTWLPFIHEQLAENKIGNFASFDFEQPGIIHFFGDRNPAYSIDLERDTLIEEDRQLIQKLNEIMRKESFTLLQLAS